MTTSPKDNLGTRMADFVPIVVAKPKPKWEPEPTPSKVESKT